MPSDSCHLFVLILQARSEETKILAPLTRLRGRLMYKLRHYQQYFTGPVACSDLWQCLWGLSEDLHALVGDSIMGFLGEHSKNIVFAVRSLILYEFDGWLFVMCFFLRVYRESYFASIAVSRLCVFNSSSRRNQYKARHRSATTICMLGKCELVFLRVSLNSLRKWWLY
jgi:hypothetical protein